MYLILTVSFPPVSLLLTLISLYAPFISSLFLFISSELAGESVEDGDGKIILILIFSSFQIVTSWLKICYFLPTTTHTYLSFSLEMSELEAIKADIKATKTKLAAAENAGKDELILAYSNTLTEQQKTLNILLAGSGNLLSYRWSISMS